ncbi:MAG: response regulator transcription factor [Flavobacteriales bacterium]|nr:response regulator transcription factor [Flavobacteriales bacterium]MCB9447960.1 response regulator transcription factor [Flavobacteriales bacterium]
MVTYSETSYSTDSLIESEMDASKPCRVLLVDDHDIMRQGLRMLLEKASHVTISGEARNGAEAVELALQLPHDLVVMDFQMPEMDGVQACQKIMEANSADRVLIISAHKEEMLVRRILASGAKGFISKDSDLHEFLAAIQCIMSGKIYLSQNFAQLEGPIKADLNRRVSRRKKISVDLSEREVQIVQLISDGLTSQEIGEHFGLSPRTVEAHRRNVMKKLGLNSTAEIVKFCMKLGYVH